MAKVKVKSQKTSKYERSGNIVHPEGFYLMKCIETDYRQNSAKSGFFIALVWEIKKGENKGLKYYQNLSVDHPNEQTEQIALEQWSGINHACGFDKTVTETKKIENKEIVIKLGIKNNKVNKTSENTPLGYYPAEEYKQLTKGKSSKDDSKEKDEKPPWEEGKKKGKKKK